MKNEIEIDIDINRFESMIIEKDKHTVERAHIVENIFDEVIHEFGLNSFIEDVLPDDMATVKTKLKTCEDDDIRMYLEEFRYTIVFLIQDAYEGIDVS